MGNPLIILTNSLINLIYPARCVSCGRKSEGTETTELCIPCVASIRKNPKPWCSVCGRALVNARVICPDCSRASPSFDRAYSAFLYDGALKEAIHSFKYKGQASFSKLFSSLLIRFVDDNPELIRGIDFVTFVPMHRKRARGKDFNHSKVLANIISKEYDIKLLDILSKVRLTRPQSELSRNDRIANLAGTFRVRDKMNISGMSILVVDDVMTTGSTLSECALTLKNSNAREVRCLTLSRGM